MTAGEDRPRLLYFSSFGSGGLADYVREQANALARLGVEVDLLTSQAFSVRSGDAFRLRPELIEISSGRSRISTRPATVRRIISHYGRLARLVGLENYRHVLLGSYEEYMAPFWTGPFRQLARRGVVWGAVMHDPVRNYIVGPRWWHRRCIASAYSFLREVFVHQPIVLDTVRPMPHLKTTVVPHGPYTFPAATVGREKYRGQLGLPVTAPVWLSFGHIRDGKNLDLVIRALVHFPEAFLVVAGQEQSSGQKRVAFYRALARQCGVDRRCLWLNRFIAPEEVGNLFTACDLVMVTYNQNFHSASGVLNIAVSFRKPCLASGGSSNLQAVVSQYGLGIWVEPDREDALVEGLRRWQAAPPVPRWDLYAAENSWRRNAEIVRDRIFASDVCPVPSA